MGKVKIKKQAVPAVKSIKVPKADLIARSSHGPQGMAEKKVKTAKEASAHTMGPASMLREIAGMKKRPFKRKASKMK